MRIKLPVSLQSKLLRVLQEGTFSPVGSNQEVHRFRGRVIAATHADLQQRIYERTFRADLYYRLEVLTLQVPSLEQRREDIPLLLAHFVRSAGRPLQFTNESVEALMLASWPGNIRQLRNLIIRVAILSDSDLVTPQVLSEVADISLQSDSADAILQQVAQMILRLPVLDKLSAIEMALLTEAMRESDGNKSEAGRLLGVDRRVIERALKRIAVGQEPATGVLKEDSDER